jgi:hypothetical protein
MARKIRRTRVKSSESRQTDPQTLSDCLGVYHNRLIKYQAIFSRKWAISLLISGLIRCFVR